MCKLNWINIFKLNEVNQYCNLSDLCQLSLVCKLIRVNLRYLLFKYFSLDKFMSCRQYDRCVIDADRDNGDVWSFCIANHYNPLTSDMLESKRQFKSDLEIYKHNIDRLNLYNIHDYFYLLYEIPNAFQNLRSLYFNNVIIMLDNFQTLMSKLNVLEDLDLYYVFIYKRANESKNINFPLSLKKIKLELVSINHFSEREDNIIFRKDPFLGEYYDELELPPKYLPNLLLLCYKPISSEYNGNNLLEFLRLNQNIKYLHIPQLNSNPKIFNLVKTFKNLVKLEYSNLHIDDIVKTSLINSSVGNNIKKLSVSLSKNSDCLKLITQQFPNLTDLYIENDILEFNQLWWIIPKFKKLKNLKLKYYMHLVHAKELNSQIFHSLEIIHFILNENLNIEALDFNINSFPKLKLIRFTHRLYFCRDLDSPKLPPDVEASWKLIYFPSKVSLYRIK